MCLDRLIAAPLAHIVAEPEVLAVVADRPCAALDQVLLDLLSLGQDRVARDLIDAHLEVALEEDGVGHAHLLDEYHEPIQHRVDDYLTSLRALLSV